VVTICNAPHYFITLPARIPKSKVIIELSDPSVTKWQSERDHITKGAITKSFFPKIAYTLKMKINLTPYFTRMVTGHGNINPLALELDIYSLAHYLSKM